MVCEKGVNFLLFSCFMEESQRKLTLPGDHKIIFQTSFSFFLEDAYKGKDNYYLI